MGLAINCSQDVLEARESYTVDAGVFAKGNIAIGTDGIKSLTPGRFKLEDFELGEILGKVFAPCSSPATLSPLRGAKTLSAADSA